MPTKKEILNSLSHLKSEAVESIEFPYETGLNTKLYYYARKLEFKISVVPEKNRWVARIKEGRKQIISLKTKDSDLDVIYSSCVLIKRELISIVLFERLDEESFKALNPETSLFEGLSIEFSHRGMELSLKSEEELAYEPGMDE